MGTSGPNLYFSEESEEDRWKRERMNEVNVFYNLEGIGDTLIVTLQDITLENRTFDRKGDVARVYDRESNVTAGFNIFNASSYVEVTDNGNVTLTKEFVEKINGILAKNGYEKK